MIMYKLFPTRCRFEILNDFLTFLNTKHHKCTDITHIEGWLYVDFDKSNVNILKIFLMQRNNNWRGDPHKSISETGVIAVSPNYRKYSWSIIWMWTPVSFNMFSIVIEIRNDASCGEWIIIQLFVFWTHFLVIIF